MKEEHYLATFIKYNNAVPIIFSLLLLTGGGAFAATNPDVQQSIYSASTQVRSIDNSYITSVNLKSHPFSARITSVTQDDDYYYLAYDLSTIDVVDYVWRDVTKQNVLKVSKALLGSGKLADYAETELAQVRAGELRRLLETQAYERKLGVSQKVVATAYKGLVGKFITPTSETLPVYEPPAGPQDADNPLAVEDPQPLTTWDANAAAAAGDPSLASIGADGNRLPVVTSHDEVVHSTSVIIVGADATTTEPVDPTPDDPPADAPPVPEPAPDPAPQTTPDPSSEPTP